jgi:hypothetical protein
MTHVYDGEPDGRQSADEQHPTSRFRPTYRALSDAEKDLHDEIKDRAAALEALFDQVVAARHNAQQEPQPRYAALAMTSLEEAIMWIVKALTA